MQVPALAEDGDDGRAGLDQRQDVGILVDRVLGEAGGAEGGELGVVELASPRARVEELLVLGVGAGPAALDVVDAQLVQLLGDDQLVLDGEGDGLALGAVAQSGIEGEDAHQSG